MSLIYNIRLASLQELKIIDYNSSSYDFLSRLISNSPITALALKFYQTDSHEFPQSNIFASIRQLIPRLQLLQLTFCDKEVAKALLPLCSELKSLILYGQTGGFESNISQLQSLPTAIRLTSLSIYIQNASQGTFAEPNFQLNVATFNSFLSILNSPLLSQLQNLYLTTSYVVGCAQHECIVKVIKARVDFIEMLEKRGIKLGFDPAEEVLLKEEEEKQKLYKARQEKLGLDVEKE